MSKEIKRAEQRASDWRAASPEYIPGYVGESLLLGLVAIAAEIKKLRVQLAGYDEDEEIARREAEKQAERDREYEARKAEALARGEEWYEDD